MESSEEGVQEKAELKELPADIEKEEVMIEYIVWRWIEFVLVNCSGSPSGAANGWRQNQNALIEGR